MISFVHTWFEVRFASMVTPLESGQVKEFVKGFIQSEKKTFCTQVIHFLTSEIEFTGSGSYMYICVP